MSILHLQSTDSPTRQRARTWHEIPRPSLHAGSAVAMWRVPGRPPAGADDRTLVVHSRLLANSHAFFSTSSSLVRCGTAFVATPLSIPVVVPALCFHRSLNIPMHPICRPLPFAPLQSCPKKNAKAGAFPGGLLRPGRRLCCHCVRPRNALDGWREVDGTELICQLFSPS